MLKSQVTKSGGDSNNDITTNVVESFDLGNTIKVGYTLTDDSTFTFSYVAKIDATEEAVWQRGFSGILDVRNAQFYDLIRTFDGNYLATGENGPMTERHLFVIKFNDNGDLLWSVAYDTATSSAGYELVERTINGANQYLVTGFQEVVGRGKEILVLGFDESGDYVFGRTIGTINDDVGTGIDNHDGAFLDQFSICGTTDNGTNQDVFYLNLGTTAINTNAITFDGGGNDEAVDLHILPNGFENTDVYIGGNTTSFGDGDYNLFRIKTKTEENYTSTTSKAFLSSEEEKMINFSLTKVSGYYRDTVSGLRHGIQLNTDELWNNLGSRRIFSCCLEDIVYDATDLSNGGIALAGGSTWWDHLQFDYMSFRYNTVIPLASEDNCVTYLYTQEAEDVNFSFDSTTTFQNTSFSSSDKLIKNSITWSSSGTGYADVCQSIDLDNCVCVSDQIVNASDTLVSACQLPFSLPIDLKNAFITLNGDSLGMVDSITIDSYGTYTFLAQGDHCEIFDTLTVSPDNFKSSSKRLNHWFFGDGAGLSFNTDPPTVISGISPIFTREGVATISDEFGQLLFYTDGSTVWDKNHNVMQGGINLGGGSSSTHSATIVPHPGDDNLYYIFTAPPVENGTGFSFNFNLGFGYYLVDISQNNGLGAVISSDISVYKYTTEKVLAIPGADPQTIWIITHVTTKNAASAYNFAVFKLDQNGFDDTPILTTIGSIDHGLALPTRGKARGQIKANPQGNLIAIAVETGGFELFDFDRTTGEISNARLLDESPVGGFYGIEFSPNGQFLYATNWKLTGINQYDVSSGDLQQIIDSKVVLPSDTNRFHGLQLGPDGKIYVARTLGTPNISVINNPNEKGLAANLSVNSFDLDGGLGYLSFPTAIPTYLLPKEDFTISLDNTCSGQEINFSSIPSNVNTFWDFGDGFSTTGEVVSHSYEAGGNYVINASFSDSCETQGGQDTIVIINTPESRQDTFSICAVSQEIQITDQVTEVNWYDDNDNLLATSLNYTASETGDYVAVLNNQTCEDTVFFNLFFETPPSLGLSTTIFHCFDDSSITLDPETDAQVYTWVNESISDQSLLVSTEGIYPLVLVGDSICNDTVNVHVIDQCAAIVYVPNAFTPNGDNINDTFEPYAKFLTTYKMTIFNQWGEIVFVSEDETMHWDGMYKGEIVEDVYTYQLEYMYVLNGEEVKEVKTGFFHLIK